MPVVASAKCCCHMVMGSWVRLAYRVAVNGPPADAVATAAAVEGGYLVGPQVMRGAVEHLAGSVGVVFANSVVAIGQPGRTDFDIDTHRGGEPAARTDLWRVAAARGDRWE